MPANRSRTTTHGPGSLGMKNEDFGKPIIAVVNSFTQFVPGHGHLSGLGQLVALTSAWGSSGAGELAARAMW